MTNTMQNQNTTTNRNEELYTTAEKAVYIALRARHEKSGLKFLAELQNAQAQDRQARNNTHIAEEITEHENALADLKAELQDLVKLQAMADRQAVKVTNSAELRKAWANNSADLQALITTNKSKTKHLQAIVNDLFDTLDITYTDRADLTQTAVLQILENEQSPAEITNSILASYGVTTAEELTDTERADAQARANFKAVVNAVGKAINKLASPEALNRTVTQSTQATAEEVNEWARKYGGTGKDIKVSAPTKRCRMSDCFDTMEYKDTKTAKGWYKVRHYVTVAPYQYIDTYTEDENGENDIAYLKTYNPFVSNSADLDRIEELYQRANLTDRQRLFLEHFARRCRVDGNFKSCKAYAFKQIGITTTTNQTTFFNRLKKALTTANK